MTTNFLPVSEAYTKLDRLLRELNMAEREGTLRTCADVLAKIQWVASQAEFKCNDEIFRGTEA